MQIQLVVVFMTFCQALSACAQDNSFREHFLQDLNHSPIFLKFLDTFTLDSANDQKLSFEYYATGPKKSSDVWTRGLMYVSNEGGNMLIYNQDIVNPLQYVIFDQYVLNTTLHGGNFRLIPRWMYINDAKHLESFTDSSQLPLGVNRAIRCDLKSCYDGVTKNEKFTYRPAALQRVYEYTNFENLDIVYKLRTPTDEKRFGSPLQSASFMYKSGTIFSWSGFCKNRVSPVGLIMPTKQLLVKHKIIDELDNSQSQEVDYTKHESWQLWHELNSLKIDDQRNIPITSSEFKKPYEQQIARFTIMAKLLAERKLQPAPYSTIAHSAEELLQELAFFESQTSRVLQKPDCTLAVDDCYMRGRALEMMLMPMDYAEFFARVIQLTFEGAKYSSLDKMLVIDALGRLGYTTPLWHQIHRSKALDALGSPYRSILYSHWGINIEGADIDLMSKSISADVNRLQDFIIIETLLRSGNNRFLSVEVLDRWFSERILKVNERQRLENLRIFTLNTEGCFQLHTLLRKHNQSRMLTIDQCRKVLLERVHATKKLHRWDYLSKESCEKLLLK